MKSFLFFLEESQSEPEGKHLKHLTHVEDLVIHNGHEGIGQAAEFLRNTHNHLLGKKTKLNITDKYDGAPSIVFGHHPQNGKFFVASKSAFNKNPKINYTDEDIDRNHGHAPGLAAKLKEALKHLPKIMPRTGGVYQGDMMYGKGDITTKGGKHHFTPNLITYSAPVDSAEGKKIKHSKFGIVAHTEYKGRGSLENMSATPLSTEKRNEFTEHPDVNNIDPSQKVNPHNYTADEQNKFEHHMHMASKAYKTSKPEMADKLSGHENDLEAHINDQVRKGGKPSVEKYKEFLKTKSQKTIDSVKTQKTKDQKHQNLSDKLSHVNQNEKHFKKALEIHHHLQQAKNVLVGAMAKNTKFEHSIDDKPAAPEGAVAVDKKNNAVKFVNRGEGGFAHANLTGGKFQKPVNEETETHHVTAFMRTQPPTEGHRAVIDKVKNEAEKIGSNHSIVLSHTHNTNNPLTAEQKLKHAKKAFPNTNIFTSSKENPTILHHLSNLHKQGVTHLTVVGGQDRVDDYHRLINSYNSKTGPHGHYNFKQIKVVSAGDRDPDAEGTKGISGTKMRAAAAAGDRKTFHAGAPSTMSPEEKDDMMHDVVKGLQNPKVDKIIDKIKSKKS
jgi:hypothetical protein